MRRNYAQRIRIETHSTGGAGCNHHGRSPHDEEAGYFTDLTQDRSESSIADWERDWIDLGGEG